MIPQLNYLLTQDRIADLMRSAAPELGEATSERAMKMTDVLVLADGTQLGLREICPDDRCRLAALFARLSPESRHRRFLSPKHELTPQELTYFTDIDHVHHSAIAAIDLRDGSIVGVARYVEHSGGPHVAELAVTVADDLQRMGIGGAVARHMLQRACNNGFTRMTATTLRENRPARALMRRLGFRPRVSHGREIELDLQLECPHSAPEID